MSLVLATSTYIGAWEVLILPESETIVQDMKEMIRSLQITYDNAVQMQVRELEVYNYEEDSLNCTKIPFFPFIALLKKKN